MKKIVSLFILTLVASGCGIDFTLNDASADVDYTGYWYQETKDVYLELAEDGTATIKFCSINDGYVTKDYLLPSYSGDQLVFNVDGNVETFTLTLDNNILQAVSDAATDTYIKKAEIPVVCVNDAVEIALVTPEQVVEDEEVKFTVDFDYRLSSSEDATIVLGYSTGKLSFTSSFSGRINITARETNTATLTITATPKIFDDGTPFRLFLSMHITEDGENLGVAHDLYTIDVQPAGTTTSDTTGSEAGGPSGG